MALVMVGLILSPQAGPKVCLRVLAAKAPSFPLVPEEVLSLAPDGLRGQVQWRGSCVGFVEGSEGGSCGNSRGGRVPQFPEHGKATSSPSPPSFSGSFSSLSWRTHPGL